MIWGYFSRNFVYKPPASVMTATANVARAAVDEIAPKDVKNKITAMIKYVQGSIMCTSFLIYDIRTSVPNICLNKL